MTNMMQWVRGASGAILLVACAACGGSSPGSAGADDSLPGDPSAMNFAGATGDNLESNAADSGHSGHVSGEREATAEGAASNREREAAERGEQPRAEPRPAPRPPYRPPIRVR